MKKHLLLGVIVVFSLHVSFLQAQETRSLTLNLGLDQPYDQTLDLEVSVRNHTIVILPAPFPIIRPIISSVTQRFDLGAGQVATELSFDNISTDAKDYSIRFRCVNCPNALPTQYFTLTQTSRVLGDAAYIDPKDFGENLDAELETFGVIGGRINLQGDSLATRNLRALVLVSDAAASQPLASLPVAIARGMNGTNYRIAGLDRRSSENFRVSVRCASCKPITSSNETALASSLNHQQIDFTVDEGPIPLVAPLQLLLD